jgi:FkbM family methyltransferase
MKWIVGSGSGAHGFWLGTFETEERAIFEDTVRKGSVVFDIGASAGFYTLLASVLVGDGGRVFAFEPLPGNLVFLKRHLKLNGIANVVVIEAAVAEHSGVDFFEETSNLSMGHLAVRGSLEVKTVSLDDLRSRNEIPVPDCVKIDVEGAEASVLRGARDILENHRPAILLATHGRARHEECVQLLESLGYSIQVLSDALNALGEMRGAIFARR